MSPKSPVRPMSLIGLILVFEALIGLQGFCMADEGWSLTGYQQIFHEPSSVQYMFLFYNKLVIGGLWEWLFGGLGIYGFRLLNILFMLATWFIIYRLMRNYIHPFTIVIGAILVTMAHNYGVMVFDHSSVTVLLSVSAAYFLFQSLCKGSALHIYIAGILLAVNIFSRIPNISQLTLLVLLIPYYIYTRKMRKTLQLLGGALLGVITGIAFEFGLMYCLGHLHLFIENLSTGMSAATSADSSHSLSTMLPSYFDSYLQILKDMLKIAILPTLALLVGNLLKQSGLRKMLILFFALAQVAILIYFFDNMLFLYAFISIILFPSLYFLHKQPEQIYLILIALLILYLLPYGSDYGINNMGENAIWLATPLAIGLAHKGITYKTYKSYTTYQNHSLYKPYMVSIITTAMLSFMIVFFVCNSWFMLHNAYFDEGARWEKRYRVDHPLANTFTNQDYAQSTNTILTELKKYVHPDDYLFCFQSRPMLHYLTHTRPYMYNPWPWSFDTPSMKLHLQRAEARGGKLPVVVREKCQLINSVLPDPNWNQTNAEDDFFHKNAKVRLIQDFIERHHYQVVWESDEYQILTAN